MTSRKRTDLLDGIAADGLQPLTHEVVRPEALCLA